MKTKSKLILMGLLTTMLLLVTTPIILCAQLSETTTWTRLEGLPLQLTTGKDVVVNNNGEPYIISTSNHNGIFESFIYKYSATGTRLWNKRFGTKTSAQAVAVNNTDNLYVTGYTNADINEIQLIGKCDAFVVKYQPDGTKVWLSLIGVPNAITYANDIIIDKSNNFYLTGATNGNLNNQILTGEQDLFIAKYNSDGVHQWTQLLGETKTKTEGKQIAIDNKDNLYIVGVTTGNLDGQNINKNVSEDAFIVKYDSDGNKKWTRLFGASGGTKKKTGRSSGDSIALDSKGICFISGMSTDVNQPTEDFSNTYISAYNPDGNKLWRKLINPYALSSIVIDNLDNLYLSFSSHTAIEGTELIGRADVYLIKYNTIVQNQEWIKQLGVKNAMIYSANMTIDKNNLLYVMGTTNTEIENESITGRFDAFITTYFNK